ncbi:hypothetical protein B0H11DRAFT_1922930 [Mycena galericulata]|nr:hypothetical protein B0H11DRAFT_1922930 [Mycena galericulata]
MAGAADFLEIDNQAEPPQSPILISPIISFPLLPFFSLRLLPLTRTYSLARLGKDVSAAFDIAFAHLRSGHDVGKFKFNIEIVIFEKLLVADNSGFKPLVI